MHSRPLLRSSSVRVGYAIVNCVGEHSLKQIFQSELSSIRQRMIYRIVRIGVNHRAPTLRQDPAPSRPDDRTAVALTAPTEDGHTHHNRAHPEDQNSSRAGCLTAASNRTAGTTERLCHPRSGRLAIDRRTQLLIHSLSGSLRASVRIGHRARPKTHWEPARLSRLPPGLPPTV